MTKKNSTRLLVDVMLPKLLDLSCPIQAEFYVHLLENLFTATLSIVLKLSLEAIVRSYQVVKVGGVICATQRQQRRQAVKTVAFVGGMGRRQQSPRPDRVVR